eukprot:m.187873 g.187873  ORF g.187873 m.187873 type:complete len:116 (+) comp14784_c2_seq1:108-455(+)
MDLAHCTQATLIPTHLSNSNSSTPLCRTSFLSLDSPIHSTTTPKTHCQHHDLYHVCTPSPSTSTSAAAHPNVGASHKRSHGDTIALPVCLANHNGHANGLSTTAATTTATTSPSF